MISFKQILDLYSYNPKEVIIIYKQECLLWKDPSWFKLENLNEYFCRHQSLISFYDKKISIE